MIEKIPPQLRKKEFRFIRVKGKIPQDKGWQETGKNNYKYNDKTLLDWLNKGENYGVVAGFGNLIIIDADRPEVAEAVEKNLSKTFTVETSVKNKETGWRGKHYYFISEGCPNHSLELLCDNKRIHCGDLQADRKQVVGPGSRHPSGIRYVVSRNMPIATIDKQKILEVLEPWILVPKESEEIKNEELKQLRNKGLKDFGLNITDIVSIRNLKESGDEYYGSHPVHGSETGRNFRINPSKNVWHCFRHNTGGGPLQLIAVMENIIDCSESTKSALTGDKFIQTLKIAKEKYGAAIHEFKDKVLDTSNIPTAEKTEKAKFKNILPREHWLCRYINYASRLTDAYPEYHLQEGLNLLSVGAGRKVIINIAPKPMFTNLFQILIGTTTISRKSSAKDIAEPISNEVFGEDNKLSNDFTYEGLVKSISETPVGFLIGDEIGILFQNMQKQYQLGLKEFLCLVYDGINNYARKLSKEKYIIRDTYICFIGGTTPTSITNSLTSEDFDSGFLPRFLLTYPTYPKKRKPIRNFEVSEEKEKNKLIQELKESVEIIQKFSGIKYQLSKSGMELVDKWQGKMEDYVIKTKDNEGISALYGRGTQHILKIAVLLDLYSQERKEKLKKITEMSPNSQETQDVTTPQTCHTPFDDIYFETKEKPVTSVTKQHPKIIVILSDKYLKIALCYVHKLFIPYALKVRKAILMNENKNYLTKVYEKCKDLGPMIERRDLLRATHLKVRDFDEAINTLIESTLIKVETKDNKKYYTALNPDKMSIPDINELFNLDFLDE